MHVTLTTRRRPSRWRVAAWVFIGCVFVAGLTHAILNGDRALLLAPVDGEWLIAWLLGTAAVIALAGSLRTMVNRGSDGHPIQAFVLLVVTGLLILPVGLVLLFVHSPTACTVLTMPDGSRDWAVCEYVPLSMTSSYSLHHGNGFTFDRTPTLNFPDAPSYEHRGAFLGDEYRVDELADGTFILRYTTEWGGPIDGSLQIPSE